MIFLPSRVVRRTSAILKERRADTEHGREYNNNNKNVRELYRGTSYGPTI